MTAKPKYHHKHPDHVMVEDFLIACSEEKVFKIRDLELEPTDVVIASYPKTGTTMLQEIVYLIRNNGDVEAANEVRNVNRILFMEYCGGDCFERFANLPHPRHMKTHLPYRFLPKTTREGNAKTVYIMRNPKDALVSYYHFYRMCATLGNFGGSWDDFFDCFMTTGLSGGSPIDHFKGFLEHRNEPQLHVVFYEDLVKEPRKYIEKISIFLGFEHSDEILDKIVNATSFDAMKKNPMTNMDFGAGSSLDHSVSPFMRKGKVGDWKNYFSEEQSQIIDNMVQEKLNKFDVTFTYE